MASGRVTMKVKAASRLKHSVQLDQPNGHHYEIGYHVVLFRERAHGPQHFGGVDVAPMDYLVKGALGVVVPVPVIFERFNLRFRLLAGRCPKKNIVAGLAVERRVEIDKVQTLIRKILS